METFYTAKMNSYRKKFGLAALEIMELPAKETIAKYVTPEPQPKKINLSTLNTAKGSYGNAAESNLIKLWNLS